MKKSVALLVTIFLCFWGSFGFCEDNPPQPDQVKLQANYGGLPLSFIKNQGQVDEEVLYYLKGREGTIYFTKHGIVYDLIKKETKDVGAQNIAPETQETDAGTPENQEDPASSIQDQTFSRLSFTLKPQGANSDVQVIPQDELPGKINYFIGNEPTKWHTNIPTYKSVIYQGLYPGIDLKVYGTNRQMEYDFIVHPGADPKNISLSGEGIDSLEVDAEGNLIIKTALTDIKHLKPTMYQTIEGATQLVTGSFQILNNRIGFDIKNYNKQYPLTIDPLTLSYSTFLGGGGSDYGYGIMVDSSGYAYVTGSTASSNFPTANAYDPSYNSNTDVFVTKLNAAGNALSYSTYLGGSSGDFGYGIAIDSSGCAYITGYTSSSNFPTATPFQATKGSGKDVFITKLNASGNALTYSTYLGGEGDDYGKGIAVDSSSCAYVTGYTTSTNFPTANAYDSSYNYGNWDAFVTKFTAAGNVLSYSTYLGGSGADYGYGIMVDSSGYAYITGSTASSNFPTANAYDSSYNNNTDAFVTKFTAAGNSLSYSTFLGGSSNDYGYGVMVDSSGYAYVTGSTASSNFPTANAYDSSYNSNTDAFVTKFTAAGNSLSYSTFLGGSSNDYGYGIAVDGNGCAYVTGYTKSSNFSTANAYDSSYNNNNDVFVTKFTAAGNALAYSTFLGGSSDEVGYGIAVDSSECAYVTGNTWSSSFPTANAYDSSYNNNNDAFVTKFTFGNPPVAAFTGTPTSGNAPLTVVFTDQSTNNPTSWSWNFGDSGTSTQQNPSHQYPSPGNYTVTLTATNAITADEETKVNYIMVSSTNPDFDGDGLPDAWEINYFGNLSKTPTEDSDSDGVSNGVEYKLGTNPTVNDLPGVGIHYKYDSKGRIKKIYRIPSQ